MYYGILLSIVSAMIVSQVATFGTTIYLHRTVTHHALVLNPVIAWIFRFVLWMTTGQKAREWAAIHRKHHAFTDIEGDPHSPLLEGFWSVQLGNVFHYLKTLREDKNILTKYAWDIKEDVWDRLFFNHGLLGVSLGTLALCLLIGLWWGLVAAGVHAVTYVFLLTPSINGLCHTFGYRNFDNSATNLRCVALLTGGEGLHNNHHGWIASPKFSVRWSEIDPAWPIIKLFTLCGLARAKKTIVELELRY